MNNSAVVHLDNLSIAFLLVLSVFLFRSFTLIDVGGKPDSIRLVFRNGKMFDNPLFGEYVITGIAGCSVGINTSDDGVDLAFCERCSPRIELFAKFKEHFVRLVLFKDLNSGIVIQESHIIPISLTVSTPKLHKLFELIDSCLL